MRRLTIVLLLLAACGKLKEPTAPGGPGDPIDTTATFTRVQNEVFTPACASFGCHDAVFQQQGMVLSSGRAYASIVGKSSTELPALARVTPGSPDDSYLYRKITGVAISGDRMPQGQPPLSDVQIKLIRDWIRRGAPND